MQTKLDLGENGATKGYKSKKVRSECLPVALQLVWGISKAKDLFYTKSLRGNGDLGLSSHQGFNQLSEKTIAKLLSCQPIV